MMRKNRDFYPNMAPEMDPKTSISPVWVSHFGHPWPTMRSGRSPASIFMFFIRFGEHCCFISAPLSIKNHKKRKKQKDLSQGAYNLVGGAAVPRPEGVFEIIFGTNQSSAIPKQR